MVIVFYCVRRWRWWLCFIMYTSEDGDCVLLFTQVKPMTVFWHMHRWKLCLCFDAYTSEIVIGFWCTPRWFLLLPSAWVHGRWSGVGGSLIWLTHWKRRRRLSQCLCLSSKPLTSIPASAAGLSGLTQKPANCDHLRAQDQKWGSGVPKWQEKLSFALSPIWWFSEAGLHKWMPFIIFRARSCERSQLWQLGWFLSRHWFTLCITMEV